MNLGQRLVMMKTNTNTNTKTNKNRNINTDIDLNMSKVWCKASNYFHGLHESWPKVGDDVEVEQFILNSF